MIRVTIGLVITVTSVTPLLHAQQVDDNPRRRWEAFYERRAYPFDRIPPAALQRARGELEALRAFGLMAAPPPISGTQWQQIGPEAIPINGTSIGRMSAIAIHPTDPNTIYVGGAQGGVWKTLNGGTTWTPLTDQECSLAMGSIVIDPVDPDIVYAGTGEQHFSGDSYYGCGVLRSIDGGANWTRFGGSVFVSPSGGGARISRVVIAPRTAGTAATTTLIAASDFGLFRSLDGGSTWSERLVGSLGCGNPVICSATDLVLDPTDDSVAYAAIRTRGVYRSTDRGATWTFVGSGFPTSSVGRINLAIAASAPATLYASVHNISTSQLLGIWKTTNGGTSWAQLSASNASCGGQCWYDMFIAVDPGDANAVYFGGVELYKSTNGGTSFGNIRGGIHVDQHFLAFHPTDPQTVYVANDGGIFRSVNGGASWTSLNDGLALTQFYEGISLHPSDQTIVLGGTQDNGTLLYGGQPTWSHVLGGDGGFTAIDHENPRIRYAETQWQTNQYGGPWRSDGAGFALRSSGISLADRALFIPPLVMDPTAPSTLYFGTHRLYRTTNRGDSWTPISPDLAGSNAVISTIAPAPSNPDAIYVGASSALVYVTPDGGATWPLRNSGLPTRFIQDIAVDRADWQTAYVVVSGFGTGHVFRTVNAGQTWTNVSGNLPNMPVNAVITDPADRGIVIIGTDLGVFMSADSGGTWSPLDQGMPNVAVFDIAYNPATAALIAATHGRGMFQLQLDRPLTLAVVPGVRRDTVAEGSTATANDSADVVLTGTGAGGASWSAASTGASWLTLSNAAGTGSGRVTWTRNPTGLAGGVYIDTITVSAAGAVDSPWRVIDSLVVEGQLTLVVSPSSRADSAIAGSPALVADSADVIMGGQGAGTAGWSAQARKGTWVTVSTASGSGSGTVRWNRNPANLATGVYVDTIVVTSGTAAGSPAQIVDTLVLTAPAAAFATATVTDTAVSASDGTVPITVQLLLDGGTDVTTSWTATHGAAPWLSLETTSGQGSGPVSWLLMPSELVDGVYRDTIVVTTSNDDVARIVQTFVVTAPAVTRSCAADHLLGSGCVDPTGLRWLDLRGNRDGQYNLGDLVALLARGGTP